MLFALALSSHAVECGKLSSNVRVCLAGQPTILVPFVPFETLKFHTFQQLIAKKGWPEEPKPPQNSIPLHKSVFAVDGIQYCYWYKNLNDPQCLLQHAGLLVDSAVQSINRFYSPFHLKEHARDARDYAQWCSEYKASDYSVNCPFKVCEYLRYIVDKRTEISKHQATAYTKFRWCKENAQTLQDIAQYQGNVLFTECLRKMSPVCGYYNELVDNAKVYKARGSGSGFCRRVTKRYREDELQLVYDAVHMGSGNINFYC